MRHDTQVHPLDYSRGLYKGYATVRNHRNLHGEFTDDRTVFDMSKYGPYVFNMDTRHGKPAQADYIGHVTKLTQDHIGLYVEFECDKPHIASVYGSVLKGALYFCAAMDLSSTVDPETGYMSRFVLAWLNVTRWPSFRPNRWPSADSYLTARINLGLNIPADVCSDNETMPLHEPSFTPSRFGKSEPTEFDQWD